MKRNGALMGIALVVCSAGLAQDTSSERVVVPARNSSHPRKINVNLMGGSITVKAYNGKEVIVETQRGSGRDRDDRREDRRADGMKRLDLPLRGLSVEEQDNVVTVKMDNPQRSTGVVIST